MLDKPVRRKSDSARKSSKTGGEKSPITPIARGRSVEIVGRAPRADELTLPLQYRRAADAFQAAKDDFLARPGVSGVDIAFKTSAGSSTGRLAIRVFVEEKIALTDLYSEDVLPSVVDNVPVDIVKGVFRVASGTTAMGDVIAPQGQISDFGVLSGICKDINPGGGTLLLTCAHVALGTSNQSALNSPIAMTDSSQVEIGHTLTNVPGAPGWFLDADLDCVVIEPVANRTVDPAYQNGNPFEAAFVKELSATDLDMTLYRPQGALAVTGTLRGIRNNEYFVKMGDGSSMSVRDQLLIQPNSGSFARRGNSGELVFSAINTAVGMIRAVDDDTGNVLAAPLYKTVQSLKISILSPRN